MAAPVVTAGFFIAVWLTKEGEVVRTSPVEYYISRLEGIATQHFLEF
jgi:hypothetical protein